MPDIGIIGAGTAGLHLALMLQQRGVDATLYAERDVDDVLAGGLPNTVAHHHLTRAREEALGVGHWDDDGPAYGRHWHYFGGEQPLAFPGDFTKPSLAVDYRLYLSRLLGDFEDRGGSVRLGTVAVAELTPLSERHDLVVVSTGRGGWSELFPSIEGRSLAAPRRHLSAGIYTGVGYTRPLGVTFGVSPGHGEIIEIPIHTFEGNATALLFEAVAGRRARRGRRHAVPRRSGRLRASRARCAARAFPADLRARRSGRLRPDPTQQHSPGRGHADGEGVVRAALQRDPRDRGRGRPCHGRPARRSGGQRRLLRRLGAGRGDPRGRPARRGLLPPGSTSGGSRSCSVPSTGRTS